MKTIQIVTLVLIGMLAACQPITLPSSNQTAIRGWLKKNLNDSTWEEVEWFDPIPLKDCYFWEPSQNSISDFYEDRFWTQLDPPGDAIRLKFRTKNLVGANVLYEKVFVIVKGRVMGAVEYSDFRPTSEKPRDWLIRSGKHFMNFHARLEDEPPPVDKQLDEWASSIKLKP